MTSLVLASQSPRRGQLLSQLGYSFTVCPADIDETVLPEETPHAYVERLARQKALSVAEQFQASDVIIGSDTTVVQSGNILGKPSDENDCLTMLRSLSNNTHQVLTAIAVVSNQTVASEVVATNVSFRHLSDEEIRIYWQTGEPQDKAGAYGIQGIGGQFVSNIHGSYSAVVGLPLYETANLLKLAGIRSTFGL
ncbi:Maf family protein [Thalassotalea agarivorans]|uniref:dTTP/UTP pyrophosphatase n=1 Tax=Thalassotalea agarivorans TaxID=349064 RepID=A0A1I0G177_THASX|nr:Maf family protein [Thalassotalea agarivorans]SET63593.1 septum formation protein [Thalassotalea agarivorans]